MTRLDPDVEADVDPTSVVRPGRRRDASRDPEILAAALDVLCEAGYDGMTIDEVAARAKAGKATLYRRWASKNDLVIDAIACMKNASVGDLSDTGTLRGDLVGQISTKAVHDGERKLQMVVAVTSMLSRNPELAETVNQVMIEPRARMYRELIRRAEARGEIAEGADIDAIAHIIPSMSTYRQLVERKPVDREYLVSLIDGVVLPALGVQPPRG